MSQVDIVPLDLAAFYMRAMYVHGGQPSSTQHRTAVVPQRCVIYVVCLSPEPVCHNKCVRNINILIRCRCAILCTDPQTRWRLWT